MHVKMSNGTINFKLSHSLSNAVHLDVVLTISPRNMFSRSIPQLRCEGGPIFRSQQRNREVSRYIPL